MAPHSSTLAWKIPWMEKPSRLQSMGLRRVGRNWATSLSLSCIGEGNGNPLQYSCLENPRDGGAWWAAVYGIAQSQTRLKRLSSSSSILGRRNSLCKGWGRSMPGKINQEVGREDVIRETREEATEMWERLDQVIAAGLGKSGQVHILKVEPKDCAESS